MQYHQPRPSNRGYASVVLLVAAYCISACSWSSSSLNVSWLILSRSMKVRLKDDVTTSVVGGLG